MSVRVLWVYALYYVIGKNRRIIYVGIGGLVMINCNMQTLLHKHQLDHTIHPKSSKEIKEFHVHVCVKVAYTSDDVGR